MYNVGNVYNTELTNIVFVYLYVTIVGILLFLMIASKNNCKL